MKLPSHAGEDLLIRWVRFNLVGAIGFAVQLGALAIFTRLTGAHYLLASAAALELTLMHNFLWHLRYTWPDRVGRDRRDSAAAQLLRFHLSNGLISLLGNLGVMRLLVGRTHLPVLVSNAVAILSCSVVNFCAGDRWAFARSAQPGAGAESRAGLSRSAT